MRMKHMIHKAETAGTLLQHDDLQAARLLLLLRGSRDCSRCGGLLVSESLESAAGSFFERQVSALRCVQCGDILDPVILRNRMDPSAGGRSGHEDAFWPDEPMVVSAMLQGVKEA